MRVFAFEGQRYSGSAEEAGALVAPPYDQINAALRDRLHAQSPHHFARLITPLAGGAGNQYQEAARLHHRIFRVDDPQRIAAYQALLAPLPAAIADGHHRYKTGALHARETKAAAGTAAAAKLSVITSLSAQNLTIDPIHRALKDAYDL